MSAELGTTNVFLGIMAAVSVLEAALLVAIAIAAWKVYGRSLTAIADVRQQIDPLMARLNALADKVDGIADDVKDVTAVARKTAHLYGVVRGVRAAYQTFVRREGRHDSTQEA